MTTLFELINVTKNYWDTNEDKSRPFLFSNITATLHQQERIALLGKSGQGKSTLLRMLALLETVDNGEIFFNGVSAKNTDIRNWRMQIAYVAQQAVMLSATIEDNLKTVSNLHTSAFDESFARELIRDVGLEHLDWRKQATDLSGGEKQRVALVRTLLLRPSILLLDEITASLDQESKGYVEQLLLKLHEEQGTSFIWVTHDMEQAKKISERIWFMEDGRLTIDTKTIEFFENRTNFTHTVTI
jgi:putative ABC transport system ATP-binding protein